MMQQLSLFRGVHDTQPRPVTLEELVTMMRTDQSVRDLTEKHRYARAMGDERNASRYKKMMASFGVAARFEGGRRQQHIVELTGLSLVDIDHIEPSDMERVVLLVRQDPHTLLAYTTLSGQGVRVLTRYALNDDDNENCLPDGLRLQVALLGADKPNGAKAHSSGELKLSSSQVALSYRATVATDAKPRAEISLLNLCRGAKEGNFKLTDALFASASSLEKELTLEEKSTLKEFQDSG